MSADEKDLIERLTEMIDQQARKKFQQQMYFQHRQYQPQEISGPGFSFELPPPILKGSRDNDEIQFAVQPFDSRYYEQVPIEDDEIAIDEAPIESNIATTTKNNLMFEKSNSRNKILIPSPMHVLENSQSNELNSRILHRAQQKQQQLMQQKNQKMENDVMQKPLQVEFDNTTSIYIVAIIAGLSCAFSTGVSTFFIDPLLTH